jgi:hypothetical protein
MGVLKIKCIMEQYVNVLVLLIFLCNDKLHIPVFFNRKAPFNKKMIGSKFP